MAPEMGDAALWHPLYLVRLGRVKTGEHERVTGFEVWACAVCGAETLKGAGEPIKHEADCRWIALIARAEQAEAREAVLRAALADLIGAFTTHRTATHKVQPMYCETCQESTAALEQARAALAATAASSGE